MTFKATTVITGLAVAATLTAAAVQASPLTPIGTDRGAVLINLSGAPLTAPVAGAEAPSAKSRFVNAGTDRGGVIRNFGEPVEPAGSALVHPPSHTRYTNIGTDKGGPIFILD